MSHKGDIEARYSTKKKLPPDMIEEMRESYKKMHKVFRNQDIWYFWKPCETIFTTAIVISSGIQAGWDR